MTFFNSICNDNTWKYSINDENKRSLFDIFVSFVCYSLRCVWFRYHRRHSYHILLSTMMHWFLTLCRIKIKVKNIDKDILYYFHRIPVRLTDRICSLHILQCCYSGVNRNKMSYYRLTVIQYIERRRFSKFRVQRHAKSQPHWILARRLRRICSCGI